MVGDTNSGRFVLLRIDAHHHLWHYTEHEFGWIGDDMRTIRRNFLLPELSEEMRAAGVDGAVAVQARQTLEETEWLLTLAGESRLMLGVVGWLPIAGDEFAFALERALHSPKLKGLRHVVQAEADGFLDREDFNRGIRLLQGTELAYDLLIVARQLQEATRFVDRHPTQRFVLDHAAKPDIRNNAMDIWERHIRQLGQRPNVACKVSGMVTEAEFSTWTPAQLRPYYDVLLDVFGPQRLMIGTDWPVLTVGCTYTGWWKTVEDWTSELTQDERAAILGGTAAAVYRL